MKRKECYSSFTTENFSPSPEIYKKFIDDSSKFNFQTLKILDETYDVQKLPKEKKAVFNIDVLEFISCLRTSYLSKGYYMFYVEELSNLYNRKYSDNEEKLMYFINQQDLRLRRLGLVKYCLNIQNFYRQRYNLYFEIIADPASKKIQDLKTQLKFSSNMCCFEFYDRIIFSYSHIRMENPFREALQEYLSNNGFTFEVYAGNLSPELDRYIPYQDLYDYEEKRWMLK